MGWGLRCDRGVGWYCTLSTCSSSSSSLGGWFKVLRSSCAFGGGEYGTLYDATTSVLPTNLYYFSENYTCYCLHAHSTILSMCHTLSLALSLFFVVCCVITIPRGGDKRERRSALRCMRLHACRCCRSLAFADARRTSIAHCLTLLIVASSCKTISSERQSHRVPRFALGARWHWRINIKS